MKRMTEILDNPLDWTLSIENEKLYSARFVLDNGIWYDFDAMIDQNVIGPVLEVLENVTIDIWSIDFSSRNDFEITGTGQQFTVFATIADILKMFLMRKKPEAFYFSSKEDSRTKLYIVFANKIAKDFNYNFKTVEDYDTYFVFERNG